MLNYKNSRTTNQPRTNNPRTPTPESKVKLGTTNSSRCGLSCTGTEQPSRLIALERGAVVSYAGRPLASDPSSPRCCGHAAPRVRSSSAPRRLWASSLARMPVAWKHRQRERGWRAPRRCDPQPRVPLPRSDRRAPLIDRIRRPNHHDFDRPKAVSPVSHSVHSPHHQYSYPGNSRCA